MAGQSYIVRIGDSNDNCTGTVNFSFSYVGPISGCTDPNACNFNPLAAMAGEVCVVEVEEIVETGAIHPDEVHLPGIYVHRIVHNPTPEKRIEKRTTRDRK